MVMLEKFLKGFGYVKNIEIRREPLVSTSIA
jgi:hypothetical protein